LRSPAEDPQSDRLQVSRTLLTSEEFPQAASNSLVSGEMQALIGPWGWLIVVYVA
jgi:hypothetical protein